MTLGDRLRQIRKSRMITLREVNDATGINYANLSEIERDEHGCTVETLKSLADFYKVPIEYFLGVTDDAKPKEEIENKDNFDLGDIAIIQEIKPLSLSEKKEVLEYIKFYKIQLENKKKENQNG